MSYIKFSLILLLFLGVNVTMAQEAWDLEKCITYALDNNLSIKQSELTTKVAAENVTSNKGQMLPNVNAFASNTYNFGQTIDPFTNQFASQRVRSNALGVSANLNLFNGFQNKYNLEQSQYNLEAQRYNLDKTRNDISLAIAAAYLQILFNLEMSDAARNQVLLTQKQLERTSKLVNAGTVPKGSLYDVEAQLANEELNLTQANNNLDLSYLQLVQLLQLESTEGFKIVEPEINITEDEEVQARPGQVFDKALNVLPELKSAENTMLGAESRLKSAKGNYYPRLSLNASIGSGYSGLNQTVTQTEVVDVPIGTTASGEVVSSQYNAPLSFETKAFGEQLSDNFNQSVGLSLNIPIFNRFQVSTGVSQAQINYENMTLQYEQTKNTVRQTIERAYADAVAALKSYKANLKAVKALNESFSYMEKRYEVGMLNAVDLTDSKTRLTNAESALLRAKYDYVFKLKILDFYQGKAISLK